MATWGNPLEWREVTYNCGGREGRGFASIVCVEADRYVVYMLDSALTARGRNISAGVREAVEEVGGLSLIHI